MTYQYVLPHPRLRGLVRDYLVAHFVFDGASGAPVKPYAPKPEQGLTFFARGRVTVVDPRAGSARLAPAVSVFGQQRGRYDFALTPEYLMVRVHFQPGALRGALRTPLSALSDDYEDAEAVLGPGVGAVNDRVANAGGYAEMVGAVEEYLLGLIDRADRHPLDAVAGRLAAAPAGLSLDRLAREACLSPRQFNRRFTERMGVGPKLYGRIGRFWRAYTYKERHPKADWLAVAVRFGYADYQHMAKDFRAFAGVTPTAWVEEDGRSPEYVLRLHEA